MVRTTKLYTILFSIIFTASLPVAAQENILYFLENTPQSTYSNPAHFTDKSKLVIGLPVLSGFDISVNNSFSLRDLGTIENGTLTINLDDFYSKIPKNNYLSENLTFPLLDFQLRLKNRAISFGIFENQLARSGFDRNLIRLINEGNYPWLNTSFTTNIDINFLHYREYSLGCNQSFSNKLTVGSRVKLLAGMSAFDVKKMNIGIETGENIEYLRVHATGEYNTCIPFNLEFGEENTDDPSFDIVRYITNTSNLGAAIDIGATYKVMPQLEVSASLINLGFIHWKKNAKKLTHNGSFTWEGFDLSNIQNESGFEEEPYLEPFQSIMDSISGIMNPQNIQTPFNTGIPTKIYIAAEYQIYNILSAGIVERLLIYDKQVSNALTLSGNLMLGKLFSLSAGYSIIDNSFNNLSVGTTLKLGPIQFYCLTDNILALNIKNTQNYNIQFGMNLMFGQIQR
jgi:hypothetical protein